MLVLEMTGSTTVLGQFAEWVTPMRHSKFKRYE